MNNHSAKHSLQLCAGCAASVQCVHCSYAGGQHNGNQWINGPGPDHRHQSPNRGVESSITTLIYLWFKKKSLAHLFMVLISY